MVAENMAAAQVRLEATKDYMKMRLTSLSPEDAGNAIKEMQKIERTVMNPNASLTRKAIAQS